jgi:hypothetical protein
MCMVCGQIYNCMQNRNKLVTTRIILNVVITKHPLSSTDKFVEKYFQILLPEHKSTLRVCMNLCARESNYSGVC